MEIEILNSIKSIGWWALGTGIATFLGLLVGIWALFREYRKIQKQLQAQIQLQTQIQEQLQSQDQAQAQQQSQGVIQSQVMEGGKEFSAFHKINCDGVEVTLVFNPDTRKIESVHCNRLKYETGMCDKSGWGLEDKICRHHSRTIS